MDTMGPKMSRSLLFWLVLVLPLLADTAVGASVTEKVEKLVSQVGKKICNSRKKSGKVLAHCGDACRFGKRCRARLNFGKSHFD